jgi:hypothetical protein
MFADTSVLIDFAKLKANGNGKPEESLAQDDPKMMDYEDHDRINRKEHMPTLLDYSTIAGSNFDPEEIKDMKVSLSAYNWDVVLNSSAAHNKNKTYSYALEWHTKFVPVLAGNDDTTGDQPATTPEGYNILGVRVRFPELSYNNWALIKPPFEIPAYENKDTDYLGNPLPDEERLKKENYGSKFENGFGVVKNVGTLKYISVKVYGCQFKNSIAVLLKDDNNIVTEYHFPQYLDFDGWRELTWKNPNYIENAANRDLFIVPLYPRSEPFVKIDGFRVYRQGDQLGGDFVTYIKDVTVTYDLAVLDKEEPIDHESAWNILQDRQLEGKQREIRKIGSSQILRFLEKKKMHKETSSQ